MALMRSRLLGPLGLLERLRLLAVRTALTWTPGFLLCGLLSRTTFSWTATLSQTALLWTLHFFLVCGAPLPGRPPPKNPSPESTPPSTPFLPSLSLPPLHAHPPPTPWAGLLGRVGFRSCTKLTFEFLSWVFQRQRSHGSPAACM